MCFCCGLLHLALPFTLWASVGQELKLQPGNAEESLACLDPAMDLALLQSL